MARSAGHFIALALLWAALLNTHALAADTGGDDFARVVSDEGTVLFLAGTLALPLLQDSALGESRSLRTADAIASSWVVSSVLKQLTRVERPDGSSNDSFPSNHAAAAFAAATIAAEYEPDNAPYWYAGAALISWSRVRLDRHRVGEVVAGAALGYGIARLELDLPRGMLIAPFVSPTGEGGGVELQVSF